MDKKNYEDIIDKLRIADKIRYIYIKTHDFIVLVFIIYGYYLGYENPMYVKTISYLLPIILCIAGIRLGSYLIKGYGVFNGLKSAMYVSIFFGSIISLMLEEKIIYLESLLMLSFIGMILDFICRFFNDKISNWNAAIHEAGHCIINEMEYRNSTASAFICNGEKIKGAMNVNTIEWDKDVRKHIRIFLAGEIARLIIVNQSFKAANVDKNFILRVLFTEAESSKHEVINHWKQCTDDIDYLYETFIKDEYFSICNTLYENKGKLISLACAIYKKHWIDGQTIRNIIQDVKE